MFKGNSKSTHKRNKLAETPQASLHIRKQQFLYSIAAAKKKNYLDNNKLKSAVYFEDARPFFFGLPKMPAGTRNKKKAAKTNVEHTLTKQRLARNLREQKLFTVHDRKEGETPKTKLI